MGLQTLRVFIGNLPINVTEDEIKHLVEKHAQVTSVELKQKNDGAFAFVDLKDTETKIQHCFGKLSSKVWKGSQLRIQKAKESFLQRLAKERLENQSLGSTKVSDNSGINTLLTENQKTIFEHKRKSILDTESKRRISSTENASCSSNSESPRKGPLQMFRGTSLAFSNDVKKSDTVSEIYQPSKSRKIENKVDEEKEVLQKFVAFSNIWKDSSDEDNEIETYKFPSQKIREPSQVRLAASEDSNKGNDEIAISQIQPQDGVYKQKSYESEKRRLKAIDDRQKELSQRRQVIKLALASDGNRSNKKIIFDDTEDTQKSFENKTLSGDKSKKLKLFEDNEIEVENSYDDFRIKNQFEGRKGHSLLKLQAQYGNDTRFTLDERFIESDEEGEKELQRNTTELGSAKEHQKVLEILGDVLGRDIVSKDKTKNKRPIKPMLRYDPTQPNHVKFKVKYDLKDVKTKESNNLEGNIDVNVEESENTSTLNQRNAVEANLPTVSKEKFYHVSDSLQELFLNKAKPFSLLEMFGDEVEEKGDVPFDGKLISKKKEWSLNPFNVQINVSDDDDADNEEGEENRTCDTKAKNIDEYGVMQESLFFEKEDERFKEGLEFIKYTNRDYHEKFSEMREKWKAIVKKKVRSTKMDTTWKRKIGGNSKNLKKKKKIQNLVEDTYIYIS